MESEARAAELEANIINEKEQNERYEKDIDNLKTKVGSEFTLEKISHHISQYNRDYDNYMTCYTIVFIWQLLDIHVCCTSVHTIVFHKSHA